MLLCRLDIAPSFVQALANELGVALALFENRHFEEGEHKRRPLSDPRGQDAYVVHSLFGDNLNSPHDKLWQLLTFWLMNTSAKSSSRAPLFAQLTQLTVGLGRLQKFKLALEVRHTAM